MTPQERPTPPRVAHPGPSATQSWLRLVLDLLPNPALVVDTDTGQVLVRNQAAAAVPTGPDAAVSLATGEEEPADRIAARLVTEAAGPDGAVLSWQTQTGKSRFQAFARAFPPTDGLASLVLLTFLDLTAQEAAERDLREAGEARDRFFSVATHELKDPLFSMQLSLQLLRHAAEKQGAVPPYVAHHLDVCGRQAGRLFRLIDNLLDVSRIRTGRLRLDPEPLDLRELAREAVSRFLEAAQAAGSVLEVDAAGEVIGNFDRMQLDQVLSNLITNALKYGAGRPVVVRVRQDGERAVLEVQDQGPGVAAVDHERIFEQFERAAAGHRKQSLGLGLYIVRSIVEAHGGTATVQSEPGQGATFVVTLPRNRLHHAEGKG